MFRTSISLLVGLILLTPLALHAGGEGVSLPAIDLDMLVFADQAHFDAVMSDLIAQQETLDAIPTGDEDEDEDDRDAVAFQDFANSIGFESLLIFLEAEAARLEADGGFDDASDPDNHHIADPYLRGVLNPQSEIMIGNTIYRHHPNGTYQIEGRNAEVLDLIRQGIPVKTDDTVTFDPRGGGGDCCRRSWSQQEIHTFPGGTRRLKIDKWITTAGYYSSIGVRTVNQRHGQYGWKRTKADLIGARASVLRTDPSCEIESHAEVNVVRSNKKKAKGTIFRGTEITSLWAKDYFDSTHWAEDDGDALSVTLSMCDCREATAAFSLPATADDRSSVILDGAASDNEDRYFLEVYQTDAVASDTVVDNYWSGWFAGQVGTENLANHYNFSDAIGVPTVYRVKLAVQNGCTNWDEEVRWITVLDPSLHVTYRAHVKNLGWLEWMLNGGTAGTTGQHRRMEAAQIKLLNPGPDMRICYRVHVEGIGWLNEVCDGATGGTTGQARRMEAIQISLDHAPVGCEVEYRAHVKGDGWLDWVRNGAVAGTTGQSRRMEALQVKLIGCN